MAAGVLLILGMPVTAAADDMDECADAGLISSVLGNCGVLGGLLGGSGLEDQPADETTSTPAPGDDVAPDYSGSGGSSGDTSGETSGGTSGGTSGSTASTSGSGGPSATTGTAPAPAMSSSEMTSGSDGSAGPGDPAEQPAPGTGSTDPSQMVGPLSELPDGSRAGPPAHYPDSAGVTQASGGITGSVVGIALALIAAGVLSAVTGVSFAVRRTAARA